MRSRFEALAPAYHAVMSLASRYPGFVGFDDQDDSVLEDRQRVELGASGDERRSPMLQEQPRWREEALLPFLDEFGRLEDWAYRNDLPYFLCCLSSGRLVEYANSRAFGTSLQAIATTDVLTSRVVHDAYASLRAGGGLARDADARPMRPGQIYQAIVDFSQPVLLRLQGGEVHRVFEQRVKQLAEQHAAMAPNMGPGHPGPGRAVRTQTVIVHGTWAADTDWWRDPSGLHPAPTPPDSLWDYLQKAGIPDLASYPGEFVWSGKNSDAARLLAARQFVAWWRGQGEPRLDVVAHSHGGNVVMRAQAIEPRLHVRNLVLLGTPARYECPPRSRQTRCLHNVYSDNDWTQVLGSKGGARGEGRTQSDHLRSVNLYRPQWTTTGGVVHSADHSDLHEPGFWRAHRLEGLLR